jgi:hypothetical protein
MIFPQNLFAKGFRILAKIFVFSLGAGNCTCALANGFSTKFVCQTAAAFW